MSSSLLLFVLFLFQPFLGLSDDNDCPRHRKPWHLLTDSEKLLYIEGFQLIRKNGKMDVFTQSHSKAFVVPR